MTSRRVTAGFLIVWTLTMGAWLVLYRQADITCGPEIYRNCQIGLKVIPGLGRPGIVLLWSLGAVAAVLAWITTWRSRPKRRVRGRPAARVPAPAGWAAVVLLLAAVAGSALSTRPRSPEPNENVRVDVVSAVLRAGSPAGQSGGVARLTLRVRVANDGHSAVTDLQPVLFAPERVPTSPLAAGTTSPLAEAVAPRSTAEGTLLFATDADLTEYLLSERRARLHIGGRTVPFVLRVRRAAALPQVPATPGSFGDSG